MSIPLLGVLRFCSGSLTSRKVSLLFGLLSGILKVVGLDFIGELIAFSSWHVCFFDRDLLVLVSLVL